MVRALCAPAELPAAMARLSGERRTSELAKLLGFGKLAEAEQRREVKRFKDRFRARLASTARRTKQVP